MEVPFFKYKNDKVNITIKACLNNGKLSIEGCDDGPMIKRIWGKDKDYKYWLSLDKENTNKLFKALDIFDKTDKEKLDTIVELFGENEGITGVVKYCKKHDVEADFFSRP